MELPFLICVPSAPDAVDRSLLPPAPAAMACTGTRFANRHRQRSTVRNRERRLGFAITILLTSIYPVSLDGVSSAEKRPGLWNAPVSSGHIKGRLLSRPRGICPQTRRHTWPDRYFLHTSRYTASARFPTFFRTFEFGSTAYFTARIVSEKGLGGN